MKKSIYLAASLLALNLMPVFGQPNGIATPPPSAGNYQERLQAIINRASPPQNQSPELTKFNLDFPGGTPKELVAAIEKATGKPLNAMIPTEDADLQMPPLKMNDVDVAQLLKALEFASIKQVKVVTGSYFNGSGNQESYSTYTSSYGFKTDGQPSDSSVWYFHADTPPLPPVVLPQKVCQFYSLSPYLDRGFTVDDITTAIQTGWKMAGVTPTPELNYHKETKLLIAFGEPTKLKTIDDVLRTLPLSNATRDELRSLQQDIHNMQLQLEDLKRKVSASATPPTTLEVK
jgi:hypothetical protein